MAKVPIDPLKIFLHAFRFQKSAARLSITDDPQEMSYIAAPMIVLSSFASELYLKCILVLETGNAPLTHDLGLLFRRLSSRTRQSIIQKWDQAILEHENQFAVQEGMSGKKIPRDLPSALNLCGKAFEGMRYIYEDLMKANFYLTDLPAILRRVIVEIKPEWKNIALAPARQITSPVSLNR